MIGQASFACPGDEGELPTRFRFTGQREDSYINLVKMGVRWYDPELGRFTQADRIIPNPSHSSDFDRYQYARGNPIRYNDPSGYCTGDPNDPDNPDVACWEWIVKIETNYSNIHIDPEMWTAEELQAVWDAIVDHVFLPEILEAQSITLYRDATGEHLGVVGGEVKSRGNDIYDVFIYTDAYIMLPDGSGEGSPSLDNFRGAVAHELAHVAVSVDPSIKDTYNRMKGWRFSRLGRAIDWRKSNDQTAEHIALAAATWEADPSLLSYRIFLVIDVTWEYTWVSSYSGRLPCQIP